MLNFEPLSASDVLLCGNSKDMSENELRQRRKLELNSLLLDILFSHVPPNVDSTVDRLLQHEKADNFVEVCAEACRWRLARCASAVRPHMWRVVIAIVPWYPYPGNPGIPGFPSFFEILATFGSFRPISIVIFKRKKRGK